VQLLKEAFKDECGFPLSYWRQDDDGDWYLDFWGIQPYIERETVTDEEIESKRVFEGADIKKCRKKQKKKSKLS